MGAGRQRWWRSYEDECARAFETARFANKSLVRALTEDGIEIRVKLYTWHSGWNGTFTV